MKKKIALIFLILCLSNNVFSGPIIKVKGTSDSLKVLDQVSKLLDHLEIYEDIYLIITFSYDMPGDRYGYTLSREVIPVDGLQNYKVIKVGIKATLKGKLLNKVLAHEMIHVKQYAKEELIIKNNHQVLWNGKNVSYEADEESRLPPWEREANNTKSLLAVLMQENTFYAESNSIKDNQKEVDRKGNINSGLNPQLIKSLAVIKKDADSRILAYSHSSIYPKNLPVMYQNSISEKLLICNKPVENRKCMFKSDVNPI